MVRVLSVLAVVALLTGCASTSRADRAPSVARALDWEISFIEEYVEQFGDSNEPIIQQSVSDMKDRLTGLRDYRAYLRVLYLEETTGSPFPKAGGARDPWPSG